MTVPVKTSEKPGKDHEATRRRMLAMVEESSCRLTPGELRKRLSVHMGGC